MLTITVSLNCRLCSNAFERKLNLPDGVVLSTEFTCAECNARKSALDGLSTEQMAKAKIGSSERRKAAKEELRKKRSNEWDTQHPLPTRMRRMFRKGRYGRPPYAAMSPVERASFFDRAHAEWQAKIESAGGQCPLCGQTMETVYRRFIDPEGENVPLNWTPSCRKCSARRYTKPLPAAA